MKLLCFNASAQFSSIPMFSMLIVAHFNSNVRLRFIILVNYIFLLSKMLELHSTLLLCLNIHPPPLKRKMYTSLPYKMLELQSSPLIIEYALHFNLL